MFLELEPIERELLALVVEARRQHILLEEQVRGLCPNMDAECELQILQRLTERLNQSPWDVLA